MKTMLKHIGWVSLAGILLAIITISLVEASSPSPELSDLIEMEDRIHVLNHQLDDIAHLYAQTLGCQTFLQRTIPPPTQEVK